MIDDILEKSIQEVKKHTDLWPWYWYSYGDGDYAFATIEAYPVSEQDPIPEPGSQLFVDDDGNWLGKNGTPMIIESEIACIEAQNGDAICSFIAAAHAHHFKKFFNL